MHALIRKKDEVQMAAANETIEASLAFMCKGLDDVKIDIREIRADNKTLRDKIDQTDARLRETIDIVEKRLNQKIDELGASLRREFNEKFDILRKEFNGKFEAIERRFEAIDKRFDAVDKRFDVLEDKVEQLTVGVAKIQGLHATVLWVCGGFVGLVLAAVTIGKAFGWIGTP